MNRETALDENSFLLGIRIMRICNRDNFDERQATSQFDAKIYIRK